MKIVLEGPYASLYKSGYVITNSDGRKSIVLYNSPSDRLTTAFARYRMSVITGTVVDENLQVDHIDNNRLNDADDNLQLLSPQDNAIKFGLINRKWKHGTLSGYRYCKCDLCKSYKQEYNKLAHAKLKLSKV
jgi:hypothetical protein